MTPKELYLEAMRRTDARELEGFLALQAEDAEWIVPGAELHGRDQVRGFTQPFWSGFSRYRHDIADVVESGNRVYAEGVWTGTHDGPLPIPDGSEVPPTGREVSFRFAMSLEIDPERQQATSVHIYFDQLEFLAGLGLVPQPAAAA
jgi:ketosteroid isomerase-like protein